MIQEGDHLPVVVKIGEGDESEEGKKRGTDERKFQELCLCPDRSRRWCDANEVSGLEVLQARVEGVAVEVLAVQCRDQ